MTTKDYSKRPVGRPSYHGLSHSEIKKLNNEKILLSGAHLFGTKGYDGTTFSEVSEHAGFTRSAIYRYYDNKPDLYLAIVRYIENEFFSPLEEITTYSATKMANDADLFVFKLGRVIDFFANIAINQTDIAMFLSHIPTELMRNGDELLERLAISEETSILGTLREFFEDGIDKGIISGMFSADDYVLTIVGGIMGAAIYSKGMALGEIAHASTLYKNLIEDSFILKK